jgi:hypothetical protein
LLLCCSGRGGSWLGWCGAQQGSLTGRPIVACPRTNRSGRLLLRLLWLLLRQLWLLLRWLLWLLLLRGWLLLLGHA